MSRPVSQSQPHYSCLRAYLAPPLPSQQGGERRGGAGGGDGSEAAEKTVKPVEWWGKMGSLEKEGGREKRRVEKRS